MIKYSNSHWIFNLIFSKVCVEEICVLGHKVNLILFFVSFFLFHFESHPRAKRSWVPRAQRELYFHSPYDLAIAYVTGRPSSSNPVSISFFSRQPTRYLVTCSFKGPRTYRGNSLKFCFMKLGCSGGNEVRIASTIIRTNRTIYCSGDWLHFDSSRVLSIWWTL